MLWICNFAGIGFNSVFLITKQPYIFSNGYKIRFNEIPPPGTRIGYIVPEWIDEEPRLQELFDCELPNTVMILPLRPEKVDAVKKQLASIHPEVIFVGTTTPTCNYMQLHAGYMQLHADS